MDYKLKCEIAGYIAVFIWFVVLGLTIYLTTMDIHFQGDIFVILLLLTIFERCRDTYVEYRNKTTMKEGF